MPAGHLIRGERAQVRKQIAVLNLRVRRLLVVCVALTGIWGSGLALAATVFVLDSYDIAAGQPDVALVEFARQSRESKLSVLLPTDELNPFRTNALHGRFRAGEALNVLLRDTGLSGSISAEGIVAISITNGTGAK